MKEENKEGSRIYEASFLISPTLSLGDAASKAEAIRASIEKSGGSILEGEEPRLRKIAYPIYKVIGGNKIAATTAYFGWSKFEGIADPAPIAAELQSMEEVLRHLIIETVRERTYIPREPEPVEEDVVGGEDTATLEEVVVPAEGEVEAEKPKE